MMPPVTRRPLFWAMAVAALFLMAAVTVSTRSLNHDVAWYLYMADAMRGGAGLYRDVADTNPPLIVFLSLPPIWLASLLHLSQAAAFNLYVLSAAGASLMVCARLIPKAWPGAAAETRGLLIVTMAFCVLPFVRLDFGQREHLAVILLLPYVWLSATHEGRESGRLGSVLIGVAAGLGFAVKPHFALPWALVEILVFARARFALRAAIRPAFVAAVATVVVYVGFVLLFVPQYLEVFKDVRQFYGGLDSPLSALVRLPDISAWIAAVVLLAAFRLNTDTERPVLTLFIVATGFIAAGLLQFKGWSYQMYPGRAFLVIYFIAFAIALLQSAPALSTILRGGISSICLVVVLALLATSGRYLAESRHPTGPDIVAPLVELINKQTPHGPIAQISMRTQMYPGFPAVNEAGVKWSLRFPTLFYLPGLYETELMQPDSELKFREPSAMSAMERRYFTEVVDNLCAAPPSVLIIEPPIPNALAGRRSLDLVAYYGQDPRFKRLFSGYTPIGRLESFTIFGLSQGSLATRPCESTR
jgi:hypothetical protein